MVKLYFELLLVTVSCFSIRMQPCHSVCHWKWWPAVQVNGSCTPCFQFQKQTPLTERSNLTQRLFWEVSSCPQWQRNSDFKTNRNTRKTMDGLSIFPHHNHHKSWAAVLTSAVVTLLMLCLESCTWVGRLLRSVTTITTVLAHSNISAERWHNIFICMFAHQKRVYVK